jgi:hypothetical protein
MYSLVFRGESFNIPMVPLITNCRLLQANRHLVAQANYDVQSRVSVDSFRMFAGAIGGTEPDVTDDNAMDLSLLCNEFKFTRLSTTVAHWRAARPSQDADARLIIASLAERLQLQDRALCLFNRKVDRLHQATIEDERAKVMKAAKDTDLAAEQRRALAHEMRALDGEIGGLRSFGSGTCRSTANGRR